jgi:hypothetical protein
MVKVRYTTYRIELDKNARRWNWDRNAEEQVKGTYGNEAQNRGYRRIELTLGRGKPDIRYWVPSSSKIGDAESLMAVLMNHLVEYNEHRVMTTDFLKDVPPDDAHFGNVFEGSLFAKRVNALYAFALVNDRTDR